MSKRRYQNDEIVVVEDADVRVDLPHKNAIGVHNGKELVWLPRSLIERQGTSISMPFWIAREKDLI